MPEGGKLTPITPGIIQRVTQAARYAITGVTPSTWFGPMQPLQPMAPADVKGRQFDYPTGYNLNYNPRSYESISFEELRALAENCDILRSVIETRKDQMEALEWTVKIKPDDQNKRAKATPEQQKRINAITEFFQSPDKEHTWEQWLRMWLEDMFVIDAASLYKRPNRKGGLYSLEIIDGASIKILADAQGRRPLPPDPAYQQILKGIPAADYTSDELLYLKHNPRSHKFYGYSHVEQALITVNILIRRNLFQLDYYREGSQPDAMIGLPEEWTTDQIVAFQKHWDAMLSGNFANRRRLKFMPGEFKYQATKEPVLKDEYDEFLARIICFVFSLPPTAFVKQMNRATAESAKEQAQEEGLAPIQNYVRNNLNRIIAVDFESPDLVFDWIDNREMDPATASTIRVNEVKAGILSIDEAREDRGEEPLGDAFAIPMALTATGYVAIKSPEEQDADVQAQQQALSDAATARMSQNGQVGEHGGGQSSPSNKDSQKDSATKLAKDVKKKPNPYLPTTGHKHRNHAQP
jgi:HK97 family phage portal protein